MALQHRRVQWYPHKARHLRRQNSLTKLASQEQPSLWAPPSLPLPSSYTMNYAFCTRLPKSKTYLHNSLKSAVCRELSFAFRPTRRTNAITSNRRQYYSAFDAHHLVVAATSHHSLRCMYTASLIHCGRLLRQTNSQTHVAAPNRPTPADTKAKHSQINIHPGFTLHSI